MGSARLAGALAVAVLAGSAAAWAQATGAGAGPAAGEALYNGIVLPKDWPPRPADVPKDPQTPAYLAAPPAVIPIDVGRQLFVDDFLIERTNLKRTLHLAQYYQGNPVARSMPYSGGVWFDPQDKLFKLWTNGMRYYTSRDGVHWDAPQLDVRSGTNLVMTESHHSTTVWLDLEERDPQRRYKLIYSITFAPPGACRYWVRTSPDGIHWSNAVATDADCGDRSTAFWNPFRKVWVFSIRHGWGDPRRRRYWEVKDLLTGPYWKVPEKRPPMWIGADSLDPPRDDIKATPQLYNLDAIAYESVLLGFFTIWRGQPEYRNKPNDVCLGFSRDGWSWVRPDRRAFCPVSEDVTAWNYLNVQSVAGGCLVVGDRLYFYVSGRSSKGGATGLATLRRDGFASMDAGPEAGELITRPLRFSGKHLFVNLDAPAGELRAEVLDEQGNPIAPLTFERCRPVRGDGTLMRVTWEQADDLAAVAGKTVKLRFRLTAGRLYAFWVSGDESGASRGYVAAGGPGFTGPTDTVGLAAYHALSPAPAAGAAPTPSLWPGSGAFFGSVAVSLSLPLGLQPGTQLRYSLDGTDPSQDSLLYHGPVVVPRSVVLKARAFRPGLKPSAVASAEFTIEADTMAPLRYSGSPSGILPAGTTEVAISLTTSEDATCKYGDRRGVPFEHTGGTVHTTTLRRLRPGKVYTLCVKAQDLSGNANDDDYDIRFMVADAQAAPAPWTFELEAESGRLLEPMQVVADAQAAQGKCVASPQRDKGSASYVFTVPGDGAYVVWARVHGPRYDQDSFFVALDGGAEDVFDVAEGSWNKWHWRPVNGRDNRSVMALNPRLFLLSAGQHTLAFRSRDPNTRLDRLVFTNERNFAPGDQ